jgi:hypothetical protein
MHIHQCGYTEKEIKNKMYKKILSTMLVISLLNLFGCYSMQPVTRGYRGSDNITKVVLKSNSGENYTFEKYNSSDQLVKEPTKLFFTDYIFLDSNFTIVGKKFNANKSYKEKEIYITADTLIYKLDELESINGEQYESGQTAWLIGGILVGGLIIVAVIASQNINWGEGMFGGGL